MNRSLTSPGTEISRDQTRGKSVLYAENKGAPVPKVRRPFFKRAKRRTRPRCVPGCTASGQVSFGLEARTLLSTLEVTALAFSPDELRAPVSAVGILGNIPSEAFGLTSGLLHSAGQSDSGFTPANVAMADLTGDGTPDLIVADGSTDSVLIYLGLGGGQFGQPVRLTDALPPGSDPVAVSVADLNGDGRLDLMVAEKGSDLVSLFMNTTRISGDIGATAPASPITFQQVATISAGPGPVSVVCGDYEGTGRYLAVGDSGNDSLMIFTMAADGTVDRSAPQVIPLGYSPDLLVPLPGTAQPTMAVVDSRDSTISIVTGIGDSNPRVQTIGSGGLDPVAAASFTSGTSSGLIVENGGDGSIAVFMEGPRGLTMTSRFSSPSLITTASPSLSNVHDLGSFVFASAGTSTSTLVGFVSTGPTISSVPKAEVNLSSQQLQPLHPADLTLVSTLLPVSIETAPTSVVSTNLVQASSPPVSVAAPVGNQPGLGNGPEKDLAFGAEENGGEAIAQADAPAANAVAPWERYISGVDEAMEQLHQETLERTSRSPSAVEARAGSSVPVEAQVAARVDSTAIDSKLALAAKEHVRQSALFESAALGSIGVIFGPPASETNIAAKHEPATPIPGDARGLDRSDGLSTSGNDGGQSRSIAVSALLAVAVISPRAIGKWLQSKSIRRREDQPPARPR